jgi:undecaprenyl-diphosphatase
MGRTGVVCAEPGSRPEQPEPPRLPVRPSTILGSGRRVAWILTAAVLALAFGAGFRSSELLLAVDEPVHRFVQSHRSGTLTDVMRLVTTLGHQNVIIPVTVLFGVIAWRRCRPLAVLLVAATVARVVIHLGLKDSLVRSRPPSGDALMSAVGNSFPSGHVISAVLIWGLLPLIVSLYTSRRWVWTVATVVAATIMVATTVSRFYMGVHWFTDAVAGLLIGWILLIVLDTRLHSSTRGPAPVAV